MRLLLALGSTSLFQAYFEGKQDVRVAQAQKKRAHGSFEFVEYDIS